MSIDCGKARYYAKGQLLAIIDKLTLPQIGALIHIASDNYTFDVASRLVYCDDGILAEIEDVLEKFDVPESYIGVEVVRLNKRTAH